MLLDAAVADASALTPPLVPTTTNNHRLARTPQLADFGLPPFLRDAPSSAAGAASSAPRPPAPDGTPRIDWMRPQVLVRCEPPQDAQDGQAGPADLLRNRLRARVVIDYRNGRRNNIRQQQTPPQGG